MKPFIFQNLEFFVLLPFVLAAVVLAKRSGTTGFRLCNIAVSLFLVLVIPGITAAYVALVAVVLTATFLITRLQIRAIAEGRTYATRITFTALIGTVVLFALVKFETVSALLSYVALGTDYRIHLLPIIGFSFLAVKVYGLFADIGAKRVKSISVIDFFAYFLFFPTFLAGPIERYGAFSQELEAAISRRLAPEERGVILARLVFGAFKVFVVAGFLHQYALPSLSDRQLRSEWLIYAGAVAYYWYEYINFSGYSDMAISTARLMGIKLPENFNYPFMAQSLTELWRRWHITLAGWLRDYVYYPLLFRQMRLLKPSGQSQIAGLSGLSIFVTFVICGLWHGDALGMVLFGVLSGFVLAIEAIATATLWPKLAKTFSRRPLADTLRAVVSRIVTFHVAIVTFAPVLLSKKQIDLVIGTIFG